MNWKRKIWIGITVIGCILSLPLMNLLPNGSTNPTEYGFWLALFIAFVPNLITAYIIIKGRERYIKEREENHYNKAGGI